MAQRRISFIFLGGGGYPQRRLHEDEEVHLTQCCTWVAGRCVVRISNVSRKKILEASAKCLVNGGGDAINIVLLDYRRE